MTGKRKIVSTLGLRSQNWRPLEKGKLKINIDGAYLEESGEGAIVVVCRDSNGRLINSSAQKISASSLVMVEA